MRSSLALLAAALATVPHATSFCAPAVAAPTAASFLHSGVSAHHSHSAHRSIVRGRAAPLLMAASSVGEAKAAFLTLAEAGPKNGVGATEEQVTCIEAYLHLYTHPGGNPGANGWFL